MGMFDKAPICPSCGNKDGGNIKVWSQRVGVKIEWAGWECMSCGARWYKRGFFISLARRLGFDAEFGGPRP